MKGKIAHTDPCDFKLGQKFVIEGQVEIWKVTEEAFALDQTCGIQAKCIGYYGDLQKKRHEIGQVNVHALWLEELTYYNWI